MKTITLDIALTLLEAITWLQEGKCLGIKPGQNLIYTVIHQAERGGPRLARSNSEDGTILIEQILGDWYPVIADHRTLPNPSSPR